MKAHAGFWAKVASWIVGRAAMDGQDRERLSAADGFAGPVFYVLLGKSLLDAWVLSSALRRAGLRVPELAVGISNLFIRPWRFLVALFARRRESDAERLSRVAKANGAAILFLGAPQTLIRHSEPPTRAALLPLVTMGLPATFVPVALLWSREPQGGRRRFADILFGDVGSPGMLRKLWLYIWYRNRLIAKVAPVVDLARFSAVRGADTHALLADLRYRIQRERRVVTGPPLTPAWRLKELVLRSQAVREAIHGASRDEGRPAPEIHGRAAKMIGEVAANFRLWMIRFLARVMRFIFRRIYRGIDVDRDGLAALRDVARRSRLCLVPSHKSHVDYLVLSYLFFEEGLFPPHIAAGENLSFWPLGAIFRRAGAFFLRRSFRGDRLYAAIFRNYVKALFRAGYPVEFFIEGGRSRTGKLLAPKFGMLSMVVDAWRTSAARESIAVVPISISYERLVESESYLRELSGGEKKREDAWAVVRAGRVLWSRYGRVEVRFARPIDLGGFVEARGLSRGEADGEPWREATAALGHTVVGEINRVTPVTPAAVVAAALLTAGGRGLAETTIRERVQAWIAEALVRGGSPSRAIAEGRDWDLEAVELFVRAKTVRRETVDGTSFVTVDDASRLALDFYKNTILHLFAAEAIVAAAGRDRARALALSRLFRLEFSFRTGRTFDANFDEACARLSALTGVVGETDVAALLAPAVEAYRETFAELCDGAGNSLAARDWAKRVLARIRRDLVTGATKHAESASRALIDNAVAMACELGHLEVAGGGLLRSAGKQTPTELLSPLP
ncbi:MAG: 1-acyl-sn-glycerol-3-phosphate acyltransferase [Deltaproteobacteria bacterium]|nr:1-acyl-sn-glycerol-3-phosphate acyltransferase [Deltaproteobacteria bacterium]